MREIFFSLIFILCLTTSAAGEVKGRLLVVTDEWAPYVIEENEVISGFDYEVMIAVFSRMGYTVDFRLYPWKRCIYMVETQRADAVLDASINETRKKTLFFPEENISKSSSVLFHLRGRKYSFEKLQDLKGLKIGTILGYEYNREFLAAEYFVREPVENIEQNFKKLVLGRIDLFISNKSVGLFNAKNFGYLEDIAYLPKTVSGGDNFVAFSRKPGHAELAQEFSRVLQAYKKTGEYRAILQKYGQ
jgi:polar amino acid transport system substrate-binding protein